MTLKANELRIGNYVSDIHAVGTFYAEVKKLDFSRCYYGKFNSDYSDLKPIPLTEEWLLKFGFKKVGTNFELDFFVLWYSSYQNCFVWRFMNIDSNADRPISLEYVHQLQNLYFALTGEELILKNNSNN